MSEVRLILGDCQEELRKLPSHHVDCVITDPPYPEIDRAYGRWTEADWFALMRVVVPECMRILKPTGSAVFILQPNSERVGRMRTWLWEFMAWVGKEWGIVQDAWWWNCTAPPTVHCQRDVGLMRPSLKACIWVGPPECYRRQENVLWRESDGNKARMSQSKALKYSPSGLSKREQRFAEACAERGGSTPFNVLPVGNTTDSDTNTASTALSVCQWWCRYICPDNGTVLDPFVGSGTVALAALKQGLSAIGIEQMPEYHAIAERRLRAEAAKGNLFAGV